MSAQALRGVIALPDRPLEGGTVVVEDGAIVAVAEDGRAAPAANLLDLGAAIIAPGFIDLHTHGTRGADMMEATPAALATIARGHLAHGVTGFLPTTMTQSQEATLVAVVRARHTATVLSNGQVLVAGGGPPTGFGLSAELYTPAVQATPIPTQRKPEPVQTPGGWP